MRPEETVQTNLSLHIFLTLRRFQFLSVLWTWWSCKAHAWLVYKVFCLSSWLWLQVSGGGRMDLMCVFMYLFLVLSNTNKIYWVNHNGRPSLIPRPCYSYLSRQENVLNWFRKASKPSSRCDTCPIPPQYTLVLACWKHWYIVYMPMVGGLTCSRYIHSSVTACLAKQIM